MNLRPDRIQIPRRRASERGARYKAELALILQTIFGRDKVQAEFRFHEVRQWRFDWAVPELRVAVEYDGHGTTGRMKRKGPQAEASGDAAGAAAGDAVGGHGSVGGLAKDAEKGNAAALAGWRVLRFTALHFCGRSRNRHKLRAPMEVIEELAKTLRETPGI